MSSTAARASVDFALVVELVGIVQLLLGDPDAHFRAVFGARLLKARLKFVDGFVLGGGAQGKATMHSRRTKWFASAWRSTLLRLDRDQAMSRLPLLIGILSFIGIQELMIIDGSLFVVAQVVIRGGAKKKTDGRHFRIEQGAPIERPES